MENKMKQDKVKNWKNKSNICKMQIKKSGIYIFYRIKYIRHINMNLHSFNSEFMYHKQTFITTLTDLIILTRGDNNPVSRKPSFII